MLPNLNYLLVTASWLVSACTAIRVEWNTNTGPIIPPTPRTTVKPVPPFREPAAVWEDLSNDIPNPNPYIYVPPPPSRPKQRLNTNVNYNGNVGNDKNYGILLTPEKHTNTYYQHNSNKNNNNSPRVASLSPQYIPNVGTRYVAVVPTSIITKSSVAANKYPHTLSANSLSPDDKPSYKLQGKYNVKTKKHKAYEKVKYVPLNYNFPFKPSDNTTIGPSLLLSDKQFDNINTTVTPMKTSMPFKSYTKHVYAKDKTTIKPREKLNDSVDKAKKS